MIKKNLFKKIPIFVIVFSMLLTNFPAGVKQNIARADAPSFAGGDGLSEETAYQIETCEQLQAMNTDLNAYYILNNDIDCSDTVNWNDGAGWEPIGEYLAPHLPNPDGIQPFSGNFNGSGHIISNLFTYSLSLGGLFGYVVDSNISNIGLVDVNIYGRSAAGGLVSSFVLGVISNSYVTGNVTSSENVGGLVGNNYGGFIYNSYSTATVGSTDEWAYVGGLVAQNEERAEIRGHIENSYATGNVSGDYAGGLVGYNHGIVNNSYSTGVVSGIENEGGLVGINDDTITNSYWYKSTENSALSCWTNWDHTVSDVGCTAITDEEGGELYFFGYNNAPMSMSGEGWDFDTVWGNFYNGTDYPVHIWTFFAGGQGTIDNPYQISSCSQLQNMKYFLDANYELADNINCSDTVNWNDGAGFEPIGNRTYDEEDNIIEEYVFTGEFNGNNYNITDLYINSTKDHTGLFGYSNGGNFSNVRLVDVNITGTSRVGALLGGSDEDNTITNCYSSGIVDGGYITGGLVGGSSGILENSFSDANVQNHGSTNPQYVAGLAGSFNGVISNCGASGNVTATGEEIEFIVGGLLGWFSGNISDCYATGEVISEGSYTGGLIGEFDHGNLFDSYSTGNVTATGDYVGGLVGYAYDDITIINSYSTGNVIGRSYVGGLVGYAELGTISNSYAIGSVTGTDNVGGLVGYNDEFTIQNSFWDTNTSGQSFSDGGTGKTTAEMKTKSTFTDVDWNFVDVWTINSIDNNGYPALAWQGFENQEELTTYTLIYTAGTGGTISGSTNQTINEGEDGTAVTAVANSGYRFVRWSDDSTTNPRTETGVSENINVSAIFERIPSSGGSAPISLPPGVGIGARDSGIIGTSNIGQSINVGEIDNSGVNVLTYITNQNNFTAPQSSNNWNLANHSFQITNLDLFNNIVNIVIQSEPITVTLKKGESKEIDLDKDKTNDIKITFTDVYVNRAEITVVSLKPQTKDIPTITPTIICPSSLFIRDLKLGSTGNDVKELQKYLNNNNFKLANTGYGSPNNETTYFGSLTQRALKAFQIAKKITPTSIFDLATRNYLGCTIIPTQTSTNLKFTRDLKTGMTGDDVKELQKYLNSNGFIVAKDGPGSPGNETTMFGQLTREALIRFQKDNNINPAIGYFGSMTRKLMNK